MLKFTSPRPTSQSKTVGAAKSGRRLVASGVLAASLLAAGATAASAAQGAYLAPGQSASFATKFWGATVVCFQNTSGSYSQYEWWSSSTYNKNMLTPYQTKCESRSFVGFNIKVHNIGPGGLQVSFPYGP